MNTADAKNNDAFDIAIPKTTLPEFKPLILPAQPIPEIIVLLPPRSGVEPNFLAFETRLFSVRISAMQGQPSEECYSSHGTCSASPVLYSPVSSLQ
jgi:hypothetical protein